MSLVHRAPQLVALATVLGAPTAAAQELLNQLNGTVSYGSLGYAAVALGDIDGDGIGDFALSVPMDGTLATGPGEVRALSGADSSLLWVKSGSVVKGDYGMSLARVPDLDNDGVDDLLVGAPDFLEGGGHDSGTPGLAEVLSGASGNVLHQMAGDSAGDMFGLDVIALGDVDGDLAADFAVGAPGDDDGGPGAGAVRVFSGATASVLYTLYGSQTNESFGGALADPGDLDGDGAPDLLVGASFHDGNGSDSGAVFLVSGPTGSPLWTGFGPQAGARFGLSVTGTGDMDLDGTPDFAVGAPDANAVGSSSGGVFAYSGATRALLFASLGPTDSSYMGRSVAGVGDVDLDGHADVLAGAPLSNLIGAKSGHAVVLSGANGAELGRVYGEANVRLGTSVYLLDDFDGDGQPEIGVGGVATLAKGVLRIYSTGPPMPPSSYCTAKVNSQGCTPVMSHSGTPTLSGADDFLARADEVINQKPGMIIWSLEVGWQGAFGSVLCLAPPVERTPPISSGGNAGPDDCSGSLAFLFSHAYMALHGLSVGTTVHVQSWYRDPALPYNQAGLSNALLFVVAP